MAEEYYQGPNNAGLLIGITITVSVVTGLLGIWRITYRAMKGLIGLSDYLLVGGLVIALCQAGINIGASTVWGYGYHKMDIPPEIRNSPTPKILFYINQVFFKVETGLIKLSISVVYMNIFRNAVTVTVRTSRALNYLLTFVIAAYYFGGTFVSLLQCTPIQKAWRSSTPGTCINNDQFRVANGYMNIITSLWLIIMPFPALLSVQRRNKELWQFLGLVGLGLIHLACAAWRVAMMYTSHPEAAKDPQFHNTVANTVAMTEEFIGIMAATIIVMRPCFHRAIKKFTGALTSVGPSANASTTLKPTTARSRILSGTYDNRKERGDRDGFNIMKTTEIEMESRDRSTDDIVRHV